MMSVQDAVVVVGNMSRAGPTMIPLLFHHVGSTVPAGPATVIGYTTSFAVLNTTAATLPRPPLSPTLEVATGGALTFAIESPFDTGAVPIPLNGLTERMESRLQGMLVPFTQVGFQSRTSKFMSTAKL